MSLFFFKKIHIESDRIPAIFQDVGQVFFAGMLVDPILRGEVSMFSLCVGLVLATSAWVLSLIRY